MSLLSPEQQTRLIEWRAKAQAGSITLDELKAAVVMMRAGRSAAVTASAAGRASKAKAKPTEKAVESMLDELEGL
jgi:hypothetical protein